MGKLIDAILSAYGYSKVAAPEQPPEVKSDVALTKTYSTVSPELASFFGGQTYTGKTVNETTAMGISTVFTCTRILCEILGQMPFHMYERRPDGYEERIDHDLTGIIGASPNADMTSVEYIEAKQANLVLQGNCYSYINLRGDKQVSSLYPIPAARMQPMRKSDGTIYYKMYERGKWEDVPREKIWHIKGFGNDGLMGYSALSMMRQLFGVSLATEEFQARFFANGANPSWIISIPQWLDDGQRQIARDNIQLLFGGISNAHKVHMLEGGMSATSATMPLEDAQFLELRKLSRDDIFGIYRVPPHMGGNLERSTNNNIEQQALELIAYTMMPYLTRYEAAITKWLLPAKERGKYVGRFNVEGLLRADAKTRAELHSKYVQNGVMDRGEVRRIEKLPKRTDKDIEVLTVQSNLVPLDKLRDMADKLSTQPKPSGGIAGDPEANPDPKEPAKE